MRNRLIVTGVITLIGFFLGSRSNRPVVKNGGSSKRETARRIWNDPRARKGRKKLGKKLVKAARNRR
ncbi:MULTISPECIES: hypothetical protein [Curtobacterium]|uniref:hypothetical protein n=1 Tax=Curtobacterium TaxID=2034 RepID=UPI000DAA94E4|nr:MULTISPECIES: hypothetical protein [Curtobacterium]MBY0178341.1 hypothetical protein [Curtobacterium herbarum]MCP1503961.1 hypothetical protein [Curtobacterium herbarum]MDN3477738.1 hypothetical protein [Curtobacterium sp. APC 4022]MDY1004009.1 hypothetical protein [Curtobacterium sp. CFBP9011]WIE61825.1 hypothetical protein DEI97_001430 [Curtobacterium sp. MCLR17_032]